jgi:hypothetical protein
VLKALENTEQRALAAAQIPNSVSEGREHPRHFTMCTPRAVGCAISLGDIVACVAHYCVEENTGFPLQVNLKSYLLIFSLLSLNTLNA